jgi:hypothetical protein
MDGCVVPLRGVRPFILSCRVVAVAEEERKQRIFFAFAVDCPPVPMSVVAECRRLHRRRHLKQ